jgi:hypothetical protein
MLDGAELALALAEEPDFDAAVRRYETPMFPRSPAPPHSPRPASSAPSPTTPPRIPWR